ncbi:hypothetical protein Pcinc_013994 [Petrolisthes cinctipes]|uniref:Uncharacterized protein n=1 Tax=Petrolisthes cinctipes TaxID=88211 RepID=A0AAE1FVX3_PETCI|nr:hypothetical protein Pcinc_013994 [Petrolisthes cinctipes]
MTSSYRSSLISHLVVQGKSPVINSVKELVERDEWRWGTQRMTGAIKPYLKSSPNPDMRKLYYQMQVAHDVSSHVVQSHLAVKGGAVVHPLPIQPTTPPHERKHPPVLVQDRRKLSVAYQGVSRHTGRTGDCNGGAL